MTPHAPAPAGRSCTVDLTCDPAAPRAARELLRVVLRQWGVDDPQVVGDATLVVSELVTNVLLHCGADHPVTLRLELRGDRVRVEVADRENAVPAQREPDDAAESGRGLGIVARLADRWGVEPAAEGKRIYAELPLASVCA